MLINDYQILDSFFLPLDFSSPLIIISAARPRRLPAYILAASQSLQWEHTCNHNPPIIIETETHPTTPPPIWGTWPSRNLRLDTQPSSPKIQNTIPRRPQTFWSCASLQQCNLTLAASSAAFIFNSTFPTSPRRHLPPCVISRP